VSRPAAAGERPPCAEASAAAGEPLGATASTIRHWLLVEYAGYWPYDPLDAAVFAGRLREHLAAQLAALSGSRLLLVRRAARASRDRVRVVYGSTPERGARFFVLDLEGHPDLLDLDLAGGLLGCREPDGDPLDHPLLLVCTHGKRDRCCATFGRTLCTHLSRLADPGWVWQSSHVGGDRFAGNVVCLPEGLYFGRLEGEGADAMLADYRAGRIALAGYRGRSCYPFAVQAAEREVRERTGLTGIHDLRVLERRRTGEARWSVDVLAEVAGDVHRVEVALELGEPEYLTCSAALPQPPRRYAAVSAAVV
jgi:hypothetical protein